MPSSTIYKKKNNKDQVAEIINYQPGWIVRNGNLVFLCFILLCISVSFFVYYPEVVTISGRWILDSPTKAEAPGNKSEGEKLKGYMVVHKSWLNKVQEGDNVAINFKNDQLMGTVASISTSQGSKDSASLYINMTTKVGIEEKMRPPDNLMTAKITTHGQKLSHYLWKQVKGFFKPHH